MQTKCSLVVPEFVVSYQEIMSQISFLMEFTPLLIDGLLLFMNIQGLVLACSMYIDVIACAL